MKKFLALCLTTLVFSGGACWGEFYNAMRSSLHTRYEFMKSNDLFNYDNTFDDYNRDTEYALKTQKRWENSENVKDTDVCVWVDKNDDNVLHIKYKGKAEQTLKFDELKNGNWHNNEISVYCESDKWLKVRLYKLQDFEILDKEIITELLWYKGAIILTELHTTVKNKIFQKDNYDLSFALLANNVYIRLGGDISYRQFNKITLAARNELWNLSEFNPNNSDICQLISYRIYNFGDMGSGSIVDWNRQDLFFSKFYKKIAWPEKPMEEGFFSCNYIYIKNPVTTEDLSVSLYRRARFSELNQIGDEHARSISIAPLKSCNDDGHYDDVEDYWLQYLYPATRPNVEIGKLTGTKYISYNQPDAKNIKLPEVDKSCIITKREADYIPPKDDIRRQAHSDASNYRESLDFVRDENGNIDITLPTKGYFKTTFNDGFKIEEGYKTKIQCGDKVADVEFDLVTTSETYSNDTGFHNITQYVFYLKPGNGIRRPFSYDVDDILNDKLEAYINKKIGESQSNPTPPANESNDEPSPTEEPGKSEQQSQENQPPTETSKKNVTEMSFAEKVKFFNDHGHAPK